MKCFQHITTPLLLVLLGMGSVLLGCDQVTRPDPAQPPSISELTVTPDSVNAADLPPGQVSESDSLAAVEIEISARATDADGSVQRVVFTFEPSSNPRRTLTDTLTPVGGDVYRFQDFLPVTEEVYTVRVFAVDDDSLASNQGVGRFRFVPTW